MAATAAQSETLAGHPMAIKVGGRRMSVTSKSPSAQKSYLASSPPKQTEVPKPKEDGADSAKSPTADGYPRPDGHAHDDSSKEHAKEDKKDEGSKKKEKPTFEQVKGQNFNKNPPIHNNFNIKQPAGKTL